MALREKEGQRLHHPDIFTQKTDYDLSAYYNQALARKEQLSHLDGDDMPTNSIILALPKAFERARTEVVAEDSVKFVVYNHLDDMADQLNKIPISAAMLWVWPEKMPRSDQMRRSMQAVERHLQCGGTLDCFPPPFEKARKDEWEELRKVCVEVVRMLTGPARGFDAKVIDHYGPLEDAVPKLHPATCLGNTFAPAGRSSVRTMVKSGDSLSSTTSTDTQEARRHLRKIYSRAKRIHKEEEAMLALCKNCMQTIRTKKATVDKMREETEAEMLASAGKLDEHIRRVTRILDSVTKMHITDATEAAERLAKLMDIDVDGEEKIDNLRKRIAYLEYHRRSQESIFYRIYCYIYSSIHWLIKKVIEYYEIRRAIVAAMPQETLPSASSSNNVQTPTPSSSTPVSLPTHLSDEEEVTLRGLRMNDK
ncbi:unnamed protein product [Cylicocyclus nassatus]|uniref:Uncharacterized protein n=1 Tax=Cylicocyclus nassatus TaxID=53992 RepID=A0AA36HAC4_CYLNA|nr:unnamed protein product [Cylicocyclus nassatus]